MKLTLSIIAITIATLLSGCSKNNQCNDGNCEKTVLLNKTLYDNTITTNYMITDARINGDCIEVKFASNGCDSKSWVVELVDSEQIAESATAQRSLKLALTNTELCAAAFAKTISFDLRPLRVKNSNQINLMLTGMNKTITYRY